MSHMLSRISAAPYSTKQYAQPCQTIDMENGYAMYASVCKGLAFFGDNTYLAFELQTLSIYRDTAYHRPNRLSPLSYNVTFTCIFLLLEIDANHCISVKHVFKCSDVICEWPELSIPIKSVVLYCQSQKTF